MKEKNKMLLIGLLTIITIAVLAMIKPIAQNPAYHVFADQKTVWRIPNFLNVVSNLPFVIIGVGGFCLLMKAQVAGTMKQMYGVLFVGIVMTGIGSGYYHFAPDNNNLVYDRIPMTVIFMSLLATTIGELVSRTYARIIFIPLLILGGGSVLWWHYTELAGQGDLRYYGFIQFYPVLLIPVIIWLYPSQSSRQPFRPLIWVVVWYVIAKLCERFDGWTYQHTGFISGHTLKHLAAAVATGYIVKMFANRYNSSTLGA